MPLSVWQKKGFDVDAIAAKAKAEDKQEHEMLGTCYRVRLLTTGERGSEGAARKTVTSSPGTKRKAADALAAIGAGAALGGAGLPLGAALGAG